MKLYSLVTVASLVAAYSHHEELAAREANSNVRQLLQHAEYSTSPKPLPTLSEAEKILLSSFNNVTLEQWSYYYTSGQHLAGFNKSQADWTREQWAKYGFDARVDTYEVFLSFPKFHSLKLSDGAGNKYRASLTEDVLPEDPTSGAANRVPTFHGYSASGKVTAEYIYVGLGGLDDFNRLKALGVPLKGKIALAKYGGPFRGVKVKNAQDAGMLGAVIFTDPGSDGDITEKNGYKPYPMGPARNPSSVQRGSVMFLSISPGDPTTPGTPSLPGASRTDPKSILPSIPSLPISQRDVLPILKALDGQGPTAAEVNLTDWTGTLEADYSVGPAKGVVLTLDIRMQEDIKPVWNVVGTINGTIDDEVIIIGNHRDAWIVGGASDPNSGSAVLIELAKAFKKLSQTGWKPKRTIMLCSWDAEEYALIGSVEFFEQFTRWSRKNVVAYLNVDVAVSGKDFYMDAVPELHDAAVAAAAKVAHPKGSGSLLDTWGGKIGVLGSGSDFTAFVTNGIAAADMGFTQGVTDPVYHYHSNYDSFHWMTTYGDPDYLYHKSMGQYLALLTLSLADAPAVLPLTVVPFADALSEYYAALQIHISASSNATKTLDTSSLSLSITTFTRTARAFDAAVLRATKDNPHNIKQLNTKLKTFERPLAGQGGLPGRGFYKHVVFAPGEYTGYAPVTFPGITEAVTKGDLELAEEWVVKTSKGILQAAAVLHVDLLVEDLELE